MASKQTQNHRQGLIRFSVLINKSIRLSEQWNVGRDALMVTLNWYVCSSFLFWLQTDDESNRKLDRV